MYNQLVTAFFVHYTNCIILCTLFTIFLPEHHSFFM
jgi:hypothetical protein